MPYVLPQLNPLPLAPCPALTPQVGSSHRAPTPGQTRAKRRHLSGTEHLFTDRTPARAPRFNIETVIGEAVPTLLINGARDVPDFLELARRLERKLPRARRVEIADAGGFPGGERPEAVNAAVTAFLAQIEADR